MAKARPLRKTGSTTGGKNAGKSAKERPLGSTVVKRAASKRPAEPAERPSGRKTVPLHPDRKAVLGGPERQMAAPEVAPPLPAPIASFTF